MKLHLFSKGTTNAKQKKDMGDKSFIMYLAPSDSAVRGFNVCPSTVKNKGCVKACLYYCGRGAMPSVVKARTEKTEMLWHEPHKFMCYYISDLYTIDAYAKSIGETVYCRSNGTSDLDLFTRYKLKASSMFPHTVHYEYTKVLGYLYRNTGVHYTFSAMEDDSNLDDQIQALTDGFGLAKIYHGELPETDRIGGVEYRVIDGDASDLRPLDRERYNIPPLQGYIVGLRFKQPRGIKV